MSIIHNSLPYKLIHTFIGIPHTHNIRDNITLRRNRHARVKYFQVYSKVLISQMYDKGQQVD